MTMASHKPNFCFLGFFTKWFCETFTAKLAFCYFAREVVSLVSVFGKMARCEISPNPGRIKIYTSGCRETANNIIS
jgi:hypothetical protein